MKANPRSTSILRVARGALAILALAAAPPAEASDWRFTITPYAWATDVGVKSRLDGREVVDQTIQVGDLIDDLDATVQLRLEAQHRKLGLSVDVFDVDLSDEKVGVALPSGGQGDFDSKIGMTILDAAGLYNPAGNGFGPSLLYGVRVLDESATVDASLMPAPGMAVPQSYHGAETLVDALLGFRFVMPLSRHFAWQVRADVSTGETDYTWSVGPSLSYAFGKTGRHGLSIGYRYMDVDFEDTNGMDTDMTLSGVVLGLRSSF